MNELLREVEMYRKAADFVRIGRLPSRRRRRKAAGWA